MKQNFFTEYKRILNPYRLIGLIILSFFINFKVFAEKFSIDETALTILKESPAYKAGELSLQTAEASLKTGTNLPNPELGGEFLAAPAGETDRWGAELSWDLEWPGIYQARKKEALLKMKSMQQSLAKQRNDLYVDIKQQLLEYICKSKKIRLIESLVIANDSIFKMAERAAKDGEMTLMDINKIKLDNASLRGAMAALVDEKNEAVAELTALSGKNCDIILSQMDNCFPVVSVPALTEFESSFNYSPEFMEAVAETDAAKAATRISNMEALPNISFGYKHAYEDGSHFNGATLGISIPLFSSRHKKAEAKAAVAEAEFKQNSLKETALNEIDVRIKRLAVLNERIEEIRPILSSQDYEKALLKAYENKVITLIDYLTERNYFTNATLEFIDLQHSALLLELELQKYLPLNY